MRGDLAHARRPARSWLAGNARYQRSAQGILGIHIERNQECAGGQRSERGALMSTRSDVHFINAPRIHHALTADVEKRLLVWIAQRTPARIGPDHLTALALASLLLAGAAYALASRDARALWLVNLFLLLNWLGDSLDGTLARVRNQQRPRYGFYVDHICDTFGALALMAGLACAGLFHLQIRA